MNVGRYEVLSELGRGGQAIVYRARGPGGALFAIKVLRGSSPEAMARFEREMRLLEALREAEGFVPVLEAVPTPMGLGLVMPLVTGGTLRDRLRRGPLAVAEVLSLARAAAHALGAAHARGIVHRDLKPENILFTGEGRPLIADLGLAKHFDRDSPGASRSVALTKSGVIQGTAGYMPPEQLAASKSAGPAADVFALGAVLYECLAGHPAFRGDTLIEVLARVEASAPPPLDRVRPDTPPWLAAVIDRCLAKDPDERLPDGAAVEEALAAGAERAARPSRKRWGVLVAALAALSTAAALAARSASSPAAAPPPPRASAPSEPPRPAVASIPSQCSGFRSTVRTRLLGVDGDYGGKTSGDVYGVLVTPDGAHAVSAALDGVVRFWAVADGREERAVEPGDGDGHALAITPDGRTLLAGLGRTIVLLSAATGEVLDRLVAHTATVRAIAVSPDGKTVVSGGLDGRLLLWDLESRRVLGGLGGHKGGVLAAAFLPDGERILSTGEDRLVRLVTRSGQVQKTFEGHTDAVYTIGVSPDGAFALTGSKDDTIRRWDLTGSGAGEVFAKDQKWVRALALSPDGRRAISGGKDHRVHLWDVPARSDLRIDPAGATTGSVAFSPDGAHMVLGTWIRTVHYRDVATGRDLWTYRGHAGAVSVLAVSPDGRLVATTGQDGKTRVCDAATSAERFSLGASDGVAFGRDARTLLAAREQTLLGVDVATGDVLGTADAGARIRGVLASADGERAALICDDDALRLVDVATLRVTRSAAAKKRVLVNGSFSADGRRVICGTKSGELVIFDATSGQVERELPGHSREVVDALFFRDGARAVSASRTGGLTMWDTAARFEALRDETMNADIEAIAVSPDGRLILGALRDRTIRLWDSEQLREIDRVDLRTSTDYGRAVGFSPDGRGFHVGTARGVVLHFALGPG